MTIIFTQYDVGACKIEIVVNHLLMLSNTFHWIDNEARSPCPVIPSRYYLPFAPHYSR